MIVCLMMYSDTVNWFPLHAKNFRRTSLPILARKSNQFNMTFGGVNKRKLCVRVVLPHYGL